MIVTILAEPRSGSTNLANWFYYNKSFTTLFEPLNPVSKWYLNNEPIDEYKYNTKNLCIKEIYSPEKNWEPLIRMSDKIIVLHRENTEEQVESFINAVSTDNWTRRYEYKKIENDFTKEKTEFFKKIKVMFNEKYVNKDFFTISYEELYYNNGFKKIVNHINLKEVTDNDFPVGVKYRIDTTKPRPLI